MAGRIMQSYPGNKPKKYELDTTGLLDLKFGKELKEKEFSLRPDIAFFNHGSYGTVPKRIMDLQAEYNIEREEHPDLWFRLNARVYENEARQAVADFIGADVENVQLLPNVTTALNTLVRSYPFKTGEAILDTTVTYGSVGHLCTDFTSRIRPDVERIKLELKLPIQSEDEILKKYEEVLQQNPGIKMVILDHITSPTAILMPVKKLTELCHHYDALAVVDGAQAVGQVPLDMKELGADLYTSNLHKWCYAPRGTALLWYDSKHASWLNPPNTSWQIGQSLDKQFFDQGTRDHIPYICVKHALKFYEALGGMEKIVGYTRDLADQAMQMLTKEVGLELLQIPPSLKAPNLRLVKLPHFPQFPFSIENMWKLTLAMFGNSKIFGILVPIEGSFYFRLSTQVYNDMEEVKALVALFKDFIKNNA